MSSNSSTPKELFESMRGVLLKNPEKIASINANYGFDFTKDGNGKWFFKISEGNVEIGEGNIDGMDCIFTSSFSDYFDIASGKLHAVTAFLTGRIKIKDKKNIAGLLQKLFK